MEPRKGRDREAKDGVSWWGRPSGERRTVHSDDKRLNDRQLRKCAENGVFGRGAGRNGTKRVDLGEGC